MKVAVSAAGPTMEAALDPRFGRCPWFVVVEISGRAFEAVENGGGELKGVAGLQAAQLVARRGARAARADSDVEESNRHLVLGPEIPCAHHHG